MTVEYTLTSQKCVSEIEDCLRNELEPGFVDTKIGDEYARRPFVGWVKDGLFNFKTLKSARNNVEAIVIGKIVQKASLSVMQANVRIRKRNMIVLAINFLLLIVLLAYGIYQKVKYNQIDFNTPAMLKVKNDMGIENFNKYIANSEHDTYIFISIFGLFLFVCIYVLIINYKHYSVKRSLQELL